MWSTRTTTTIFLWSKKPNRIKPHRHLIATTSKASSEYVYIKWSGRSCGPVAGCLPFMRASRSCRAWDELASNQKKIECSKPPHLFASHILCISKFWDSCLLLKNILEVFNRPNRGQNVWLMKNWWLGPSARSKASQNRQFGMGGMNPRPRMGGVHQKVKFVKWFDARANYVELNRTERVVKRNLFGTKRAHRGSCPPFRSDLTGTNIWRKQPPTPRFENGQKTKKLWRRPDEGFTFRKGVLSGTKGRRLGRGNGNIYHASENGGGGEGGGWQKKNFKKK